MLWNEKFYIVALSTLNKTLFL